MAKRKTKAQYISAIKKKAKACGVTIIGKIEDKEKIILSSKLVIYHAACKKTRRCKVSSFLAYPDCQYCNKVSRNNALIERRKKAYISYKKPKKGKSAPKRITKLLASKTGPLNTGELKLNEKPTAGEKEVASVLCKLKVPYSIEFPIWLNVHSKTPLRADFCVELDGINYIIEYDGEQHFRPIRKYGGYRGYYRTLMLDEAKDRYLKARDNCKLLRIPYWEFDNMEYYIRKFLPLT